MHLFLLKLLLFYDISYQHIEFERISHESCSYYHTIKKHYSDYLLMNEQFNMVIYTRTEVVIPKEGFRSFKTLEHNIITHICYACVGIHLSITQYVSKSPYLNNRHITITIFDRSPHYNYPLRK